MITTTAMEARLLSMIEPSLQAMGYRVVQLRLMESKRHKTLQCLMEHVNDASMTVGDCEKISHTISALLDVEDPIASAYHLEVSSAGMERPLTRIEDFTRFTGMDAQVDVLMPHQGRRRFKGIIQGRVDEDLIAMECEGQVFNLPFSQIKQAKLIATEAWLKRLFSQEHAEQKQKRKDKKTEKKQKRDHKKRTAVI